MEQSRRPVKRVEAGARGRRQRQDRTALSGHQSDAVRVGRVAVGVGVGLARRRETTSGCGRGGRVRCVPCVRTCAESLRECSFCGLWGRDAAEWARRMCGRGAVSGILKRQDTSNARTTCTPTPHSLYRVSAHSDSLDSTLTYRTTSLASLSTTPRASCICKHARASRPSAVHESSADSSISLACHSWHDDEPGPALRHCALWLSAARVTSSTLAGMAAHHGLSGALAAAAATADGTATADGATCGANGTTGTDAGASATSAAGRAA